jgi:hypothetical protein
MIATGAIFVSVTGLKTWDQVTLQYPAQVLLAMAAGMTIPMAAWMLLRGMGRRNTAEMAAAMKGAPGAPARQAVASAACAFLDPERLRRSTAKRRVAPTRRAAIALARRKLGMRYLMNVVGLDAGAAAVRGTHGRLPASPQDGPVLLCSSPQGARDRYEATEVKNLLLHLAGLS